MCNRSAHPSFVFIKASGVSSARTAGTYRCGEPRGASPPDTRVQNLFPSSLTTPPRSLGTGKQCWPTSSTKTSFALLLSTLQNLNPQYLKNSNNQNNVSDSMVQDQIHHQE